MKRHAAVGDPNSCAPRVTYVVTGYPYVSHTFVQREVLALRRLGATIDTVAVRRSVAGDVLSDDDRREFATTYALRPLRVGRYLRAHLRALLSPDAGWGRGLRLSLRLASAEPRSVVWRVFYFVQAVVLWDHARATGTTHVHAHFANVSSDLAMLAKEVGGEDWSWSFTMHGPTEFSDVTAFRLAEKTQSASFVACISDFCRSQLMALVPASEWSKLRVVHCGVDPERFAPADDGRPDGPLRVVCVARMSPVKGQAVLVEALRRLRADGVDVEVMFIGDGPDREAVAREVADSGLSDRVTFTGALGQDEVLTHLRSSDVLCLPSFAEGVPVVLMEAMSLGLPVVCSRIAGIPELVGDGESGVVVAPGRPDLIAGALAELGADPDRRRRMGREGRRRIVSEYAVDPNAALLLRAFEDTVCTRRGEEAAPR